MQRLTRRNFFGLAGLYPLSVLLYRKDWMRKPEMDIIPTKSLQRYDPWIELNMTNLAWNLNQIKKAVKVPVMAVIKGNAYGHGLVEIGRALERSGVDQLMVAKLQEAAMLREKGIRVPVLNFGPLHESDAEALVQLNIAQSVFTDDIKGLNEFAMKKGKKALVHIHVDTGMTRMGISHKRALPYIESVSKLKGIAIVGVSSTFTEGDELDKEQLRIFLDICQKAGAKGIRVGLKHIASSDAVLDMPESYLDMVRPGTCLFGAYPNQETQDSDPLKLKPVMQLKSRVVTVKTLESGDGVSYHHSYKAKKKEKVAILAVGYSDGYPHRAIGKAQVLIKGKRHPLIASVTANHCEVLMDDTSAVRPGDEVVLLGQQGEESIWSPEMGEWDGSSSYKIMFGMSPFLPRIIVE